MLKDHVALSKFEQEEKVRGVLNNLSSLLETVEHSKLYGEDNESYLESTLSSVEKLVNLLVYYHAVAEVYNCDFKGGSEDYSSKGVDFNKCQNFSEFRMNIKDSVVKAQSTNESNIELRDTFGGKLIYCILRLLALEMYEMACVLINRYRTQVGVVCNVG